MESEQKEGKSCSRTAFTCLIIAVISVVGAIVFINISIGWGDMRGCSTLSCIAADLGLL